MSSSSSSNASGVVHSTDISLAVKDAHRQQRDLAKQASGKKGAFNIFQDQPPKSAVVNKAQFDALYDNGSIYPAPVSKHGHTTLRLAPESKNTSTFKPSGQSLATDAQRKAPVSQSAICAGYQAKSTIPSGKTWAKATAPTVTTSKHSTSFAKERTPIRDSYAAKFPKLGYKQDSAVEGPTMTTTTAALSKSDKTNRASDGFTVVEYTNRRKEKHSSSSERVTIATNMANNKFEPLSSQDDSDGQLRSQKPKSACSNGRKKTDGGASNLVVFVRPNASQEAIAQKENQVWTTVGSKKSAKPTKKIPKKSSEVIKSNAPSLAPITPVYPHQDAEFPSLAASVTSTKKIPHVAPVIMTSTARTSRAQQPASPISPSTEPYSSKNVEYPSLPASPSHSENPPSKIAAAKASKSRRRKRLTAAVARKGEGGEGFAALPKPVPAPVSDQAKVTRTGESKKLPEVEVQAQVTLASETGNTTAVTPLISDEECALADSDTIEPFLVHGRGSVSSSKPSNLQALHQEGTHQYQETNATTVSFSDLHADLFEYAALDSRMTLFHGFHDPFDKDEECGVSTFTIDPVTSDEARQYQQAVEPDDTATESRVSDIFVTETHDGPFPAIEPAMQVQTLEGLKTLIMDGAEHFTLETRPTASGTDDLVSEADDTYFCVNLFAEGFEHGVCESRMTLQFGFDDFLDESEEPVKLDLTDNSIATIEPATQIEAVSTIGPVLPIESDAFETRVADDLDADSCRSMDASTSSAQTISEDIIEMSTKDDEDVHAMKVKVPSADQSTLDEPAIVHESTVHSAPIHEVSEDDIPHEDVQGRSATTPREEIPLTLEEIYIELDEKIQRLCDIALAELTTRPESDGKLAKGDLSLLRQDHGYGRSLPFFEDEPTEVSKPKLETDAAGSNTARLTDVEARANQTFMGTARIIDILQELSLKPSKNGMHTKSQIVEVFALFSTRERKLVGLDPLCDISEGRNILKSIILQHKICLGRTKLVDFIEMIDFENKLATSDAVAAGCMMASRMEKGFWESEIGRKMGEMMHTLA